MFLAVVIAVVVGFHGVLWYIDRPHRRVNWLLLLAPGLGCNLLLWHLTHVNNNRVLAVLYALALVGYISYRLREGVPDGHLCITLAAECDPTLITVPKGTEFTGGRGDVLVATCTCRVSRWQLWWARRWRHDLPRQIVVPVRRIEEL